MILQKYCVVAVAMMLSASSYIRNLHIGKVFRQSHGLIGRAYCAPLSPVPSDHLKKHEVFANANAPLLAMELPNNENSDLLLKTRHTSAHILAMAVQKTFPHVKVTIGPWIESG